MLTLSCSVQAELAGDLTQAAEQRLARHAAEQDWLPYQAEFTPWLPAGASRLPACSRPLRFEPAQADGEPWGRVPYLVHCPDEPGWTTRARVKVTVRMPVWVAAERLRREQELTPSAVQLQSLSLERLYRGFVAGRQPPRQRLLRDLPAGEPLYPALLAPPWLVKKKEQVVIEAVGDGFTITTRGLALSNGSQGELVRVRNTGSGKVIQARVVDKNRVQSLR
ncbi:flagellar basal body P-ring formation chaperone FlgA [Oceanimonas sp. CHS3-5]|uniref:flagellar basal body P-ring formation chaperone FlgA n=1 Tax=Oceanimonas sp. CHS3-5 TaxID=3068186 RepID=UPI00273DBDFC|nr:flagellar basal body P-ring formation chaperone FlgA [Oceanimonas sp. CHS3-5]MDP5292392.1 flagellar basal body P-ring formation chaperone FlgA [Oceanimonas sp. CHS3-5]